MKERGKRNHNGFKERFAQQQSKNKNDQKRKGYDPLKGAEKSEKKDKPNKKKKKHGKTKTPKVLG